MFHSIGRYKCPYPSGVKMGDVLLAEVPGVGREFLRQAPQVFFDHDDHGFHLSLVVGLCGDTGGDDHLHRVVEYSDRLLE